ncbi:type II secretion system protein [Catenovulum sp. SM1970]|uniref:pilus assembly FimT family protein n=1 Tax=Marinifaba aquimaris TaxID=2741323 RepID=UPI0015730570|nr:type II secretion system protein [Marinifaba aquimaris]NTS75867.1 type II secretion system protein [Marinifaba aquimaris]
MLGRLRGFTFIELVVVILLISILAVTVIPRFLDTSGFDQVTFEQRLVALLRLQQLKAMQLTNNTCHRVLITNERFGVPYDAAGKDCVGNTLPSDYTSFSDFDKSHYGLSTFEVTGADVTFSNHDIYFNSLGCPAPAAGGACGNTDVAITITGESTRQICIESQGYIHYGSCDNG